MCFSLKSAFEHIVGTILRFLSAQKKGKEIQRVKVVLYKNPSILSDKGKTKNLNSKLYAVWQGSIKKSLVLILVLRN